MYHVSKASKSGGQFSSAYKTVAAIQTKILTMTYGVSRQGTPLLNNATTRVAAKLLILLTLRKSIASLFCQSSASKVQEKTNFLKAFS